MYLRLLVVIGIFNWSLALALAPKLVGLFALGAALAGVMYRFAGVRLKEETEHEDPHNPLELGSAAIFAFGFIFVSVIANSVRARYGETGIEILAAIVGVTDIDPFVLNIAQGGAGAMSVTGAASAVLIATASNNLLKASYTAAFAGLRVSLPAIAALVALAAVAVATGLLP